MDYKTITSYEKACQDQKRDPALRPDVSMLEPDLQKFLMAAYELAIVNRSLNKDKKGNVTKANWNTGEEKWFPWMDVEADDDHPSGSGLSFYATGFGRSGTNVASRLTSRESKIAKFFFENFKSQWEDYILDRD